MKILALDGHDASGKTTLAKRLAQELDAVYVRPFGGKVGEAMLQASEEGDIAKVWTLACKPLGEALVQNKERILVFDRFLPTILTLCGENMLAYLPEGPIPCILCWSDLPTTLARLGLRDEPKRPLSWYEKYLAQYTLLAKELGLPLLRTDTQGEDESFTQLLTWAREQLQTPKEWTKLLGKNPGWS